ncbi:DUF3327 domain-containing protein [Arthrobacter sp. Sa2BUA2]|uniref:DUF3327 domain-containing protein n=1 Tax=Arthrobacter pullicola TaxID=2762224 RepID=A0ABR8YEU3_9MICC|nr:alpha/beta hydrolase-fold protein [Arthrobacter pullicola]MBD8042741.1 DUF3327 domain-containing protein [Arthrobacter pullicola]
MTTRIPAAAEGSFPLPRDPVPQPAPALSTLPGHFRAHWQTLSVPERAQLLAGWDTRELPLIEEDPQGDPAVRAVTFLYRNPLATAVILSANAMVHPDTVSACEFEALPDGLWALTWRMPADWESSYRITVHTGAPPAPWQSADDRRAVRLAADAGGPDPRNPALGTGMAGAPTSVLRLPDAPSTGWLATPTPAAESGASIMGEPARPRLSGRRNAGVPGVPTAPRQVLGNFVRGLELRQVRDRQSGQLRTLWLYRPRVSGGRRTPLVLLHDGQVWAKYQNLPATLDRAIADGVLPPIHVAMIDSVDVPTRSRELSGPKGGVDFVARDLLPELRQALPVTQDPLQTVVSGASYGGLAALWQLARYPQAAGTALAQSPSLWRYDLAEPLLAVQEPLRVRIQAGRYEPSIHEPAGRLNTVLAGSGVDTAFRSITGGHDWAWWHPWLIRGLSDLFSGQ